MDAEITILAIRQRSFDELCEDIEKQLEEGLQGERVGEELKGQLSNGARELLALVDDQIRTTQNADTRQMLAETSEVVRRIQRTLALKITKACGTDNPPRDDEPLMNSTMREVIAATGYMREPKVAKFDGSAESWPTFRDLFISEVHQRYPDDVTKLVYLQQLCVGGAKQTLGQWQPTAANYKLAWDTLCARYEDERAIKQAAAHILTTLTPVRRENRDGLRKLIDTTNNALRQLEAAGCPTSQWDELVISKWMECLPDATYRKWKRHLRGRSDVTYRELCEFVEVEARTCDEIERREKDANHHGDNHRDQRKTNRERHESRTNRYNERRNDRNYGLRNDRRVENKPDWRNNKPSTRQSTDHRSTNTTSSQDNNLCPICNNKHWPWMCERFRKMTLQERKDEVNKKKLCNRCLKDHHGGECKSNFVCRKCGQPHSSLLCKERRPNDAVHKPQ